MSISFRQNRAMCCRSCPALSPARQPVNTVSCHIRKTTNRAGGVTPTGFSWRRVRYPRMSVLPVVLFLIETCNTLPSSVLLVRGICPNEAIPAVQPVIPTAGTNWLFHSYPSSQALLEIIVCLLSVYCLAELATTLTGAFLRPLLALAALPDGSG
jgi:hypothetical protein